MPDFILSETGDRIVEEDGSGAVLAEADPDLLPVFTIGAAFTPASGNPLDTGAAYTNLAADLETMTITRGRQTEDDQAATGNGRLVLVDDSRKYDPNYSSSPYYPNVEPMVPFYITALHNAVTYPVFRAWVDIQDAWVRDESEPGRAVVSVALNDGFEILNNARLVDNLTTHSGHIGGGIYTTSSLGTPFAQEDTGTRIGNALGKVTVVLPGIQWETTGMDPQWPTAWRNLETGIEQMQSVAAASNVDASPLAVIRDAETTEPGFFFFDQRGYATFHNRRHRSLATSKATFCDRHNEAGGRILFGDSTTRRTSIANDVRATRNGGTKQQLEDPTSIQNYLRRAKDYATQHISDVLALNFATWMLSVKKDTYEVLESITLIPGTDTATWTQILARDIGDRITIVRTPQGVGSPITLDYFIEGITLTWGPGPDASCVWRVSSAFPTQMWSAGVAGASEAGLTTKAAY